MNWRAVPIFVASTVAACVNAQISLAECTCMCVDGEIRPLCQNALDQPPICSPTICPIVAPSIEPIAPPIIPPIGTQACRMQQVCDGFGSCEWKQLCY